MSADDQTQPAGAVNPEAGDHRITADPGLLAACERAIEVTYADHPYYEARYASRGRRFSSSDSGWIVRLGVSDPAHAWQQTSWLAQVLAARGMPTVLLEHHLFALAAEVGRVTGQDARSAALADLAARMHADRTSVLDEATTARLEADFDAATAGEPDAVPRVGLLVITAVVDEVRGLRNVESSLHRWLADPDRWSARWVEAVRATSDATREAVQPADA